MTKAALGMWEACVSADPVNADFLQETHGSGQSESAMRPIAAALSRVDVARQDTSGRGAQGTPLSCLD